MAKEAVAAFYAFLEKTPEVKQEALSLQERFEEQEDRIDELIRIAERNGFSFTVREFVQFLYERSV
ncbi:MAG: Nif11 family protein [Lentisphaerae bacterium]|nr:Nif11 family protein [Lentisphaerota bacterium]